jgi:hypothetical protein
MDIFKMDLVRGQPVHAEKDAYDVAEDTFGFLWQLPGMIKDGVLGLTKYISKNK